ncbi:MAG: hypothetical protein HC900_03720 [Methylacidiphilales bacterium]|nr:hypothetical protein [Candidatus Methylacidiphilales bacterium]
MRGTVGGIHPDQFGSMFQLGHLYRRGGCQETVEPAGQAEPAHAAIVALFQGSENQADTITHALGGSTRDSEFHCHLVEGQPFRTASQEAGEANQIRGLFPTAFELL